MKDSSVTVLKRRGHATQGHMGRHPGQSRGKRSKGKVWMKAFSLCGKDWVKSGKQDWDWLVGIPAVALGCGGCPELSSTWPWGDERQGDSVPHCQGLKKEVLGLALQIKGVLKGPSFTLSRN